jgi:hypothetical protein
MNLHVKGAFFRFGENLEGGGVIETWNLRHAFDLTKASILNVFLCCC